MLHQDAEPGHEFEPGEGTWHVGVEIRTGGERVAEDELRLRHHPTGDLLHRGLTWPWLRDPADESIHELAVLAGGGAAVCAAGAVGGLRASVPALVVAAAVRVGEARTEPSLRRIAEIFLEVGATLYGSGYVLLAWLDSRFVGPGLIDRVQLLDAIAVGQITPGPVFSTATFVGWQLAGPAGAATATVAIFAPAFVFVALLGRLTAWLDRHRAGRDFLDGLVAASLGMMVAVVVPMAETSLGDPLAVATAIAAMAVLSARLTSATVVVIGGALIGAARLVL